MKTDKIYIHYDLNSKMFFFLGCESTTDSHVVTEVVEYSDEITPEIHGKLMEAAKKQVADCQVALNEAVQRRDDLLCLENKNA